MSGEGSVKAAAGFVEALAMLFEVLVSAILERFAAKKAMNRKIANLILIVVSFCLLVVKYTARNGKVFPYHLRMPLDGDTRFDLNFNPVVRSVTST